MLELTLNIAFLRFTIATVAFATVRGLEATTLGLGTAADQMVAYKQLRDGEAYSKPALNGVDFLVKLAVREHLALPEKKIRGIARGLTARPKKGEYEDPFTALRRIYKEEVLLRAALPVMVELALKEAPRFEGDPHLAFSAIWEEGQKAVHRFKPAKAGATPFAAFMKQTLTKRMSVLVDDVLEGGRDLREKVAQLKRFAYFHNLEDALYSGDAEFFQSAAAAALEELEIQGIELGPEDEGRQPAWLSNTEVLQAVLELVVALGSNVQAHSLDFTFDDDEGNETRYGDSLALIEEEDQGDFTTQAYRLIEAEFGDEAIERFLTWGDKVAEYFQARKSYVEEATAAYAARGINLKVLSLQDDTTEIDAHLSAKKVAELPSTVADMARSVYPLWADAQARTAN